MSVLVGPFAVQDATPAELARVQSAAGRLPPEMVAQDAARPINLWFHRRGRAPSWAWGYAPNRNNIWVNPIRQPAYASLDAQQGYVILHEYLHAWHGRRGRSVPTDELKALVVGTMGNVETARFTNRFSEALADAFASALGGDRGVRPGYFRAAIPSSAYGTMLELLAGKVPARPPRATHTLRRSGPVALRESPLVSAPVVAWAVSGSLIRAVAGRSGGLYYVRAGGLGYRSRLWLEVVALDGLPLPAPLWSAELLWSPLPASPAPPSSPA